MGKLSRELKRRQRRNKPLPQHSLSGRLQEVAQPLLRIIGKGDGSDEYVDGVRGIFNAARIAWNCAVSFDADVEVEESEEILASLPTDMKAAVYSLMERKRDLFPNDYRMVVHVDIVRRGKELRVEVGKTKSMK